MKPYARILTVAVLLCSLVFAALSRPAQADSLYVRKIVSVVYDDSGSMKSDSNWVYASYAMQAFAALMNENDRLFITYMSETNDNPNYDPPSVDLSNEGIQASVDRIRTHFAESWTPYAAVEAAFSKLCSIQDESPNTEYWLVILTDGQFQDLNRANLSEDFLTRSLSGYAATVMPNGSTPKITYLAIGSGATFPDDRNSQGIYVYKSSGTNDLVHVMSEMANRISGRMKLAAGDLKKTDPNTLRLHSDVPLLNIAVLSQRSDVRILEVRYEEGGTLNLFRQVSVAYPEGIGGREPVRAQACLINNGDRNINAGNYTITFDGPVDTNDLVVMFEPALELRLRVSINGMDCDDLRELSGTHEGDVVDLRCELFEIGTGNAVSPDLLPEGTRFALEVLENGMAASSDDTSDLSLEGYTLTHTPTAFRAEIEIPGLRPIQLDTGVFTPGKPIVYSIEVEQPENFSLTMDELKVNKEKIRFVVYEDGLPVPAERMKQLSFRVETEMPGKLAFEPDGSVSFTPLYRDPVTTIPTGTVLVTGILNDSHSTSGSLYVKPVEYEIRALGPTAAQVDRRTLGEGEEGLRFALYADGKQLGRQAVEAAALELEWNAPYRGRLEHELQVDDLGNFTLIPRFRGWSYFIPYLIPRGTLEGRVAFQGAEASDSMELTGSWKDIVLNYVLPVLALTYLFGSIFKKRFVYSNRICTNHGSGKGMLISGPMNGWFSKSLFTPLAFVPILPDSKSIDGVRFYATGRFSSRRSIGVHVAKLSPTSGVLNGGQDEMRPLKFRKSEVDRLDGKQKLVLNPTDTLVVSADAAFSACEAFLYVE